jgi:replication-associated recombination protein RarA
MSQACSEGTVRALILSGPPGVGKSYGVTNQLQKANLFNTIQNKQRWEVVKGATSAIGLYKKLYEYSAKGSVIVFDDCDTVLFDDLSLNILKAALDSGKKRIIQWNTESRVLDREGIPDKFEFDGAVIFITNVKFDQVRSKKLQDHLSALMSRCHYIDLTIDSAEDKLLRIKSVIEQGMLEEYQFADVKAVEQQILDYMGENMKRMNELSLRMAIKLAELIKMRPDSWKLVADVTCMKRGA